MLAGPGRWGTSTPALGVPVSFAEIDTVSILCEIAVMLEGLIPDVSLGTHFFNDLVEMDALYVAVFPERSGGVWDEKWMEAAESRSSPAKFAASLYLTCMFSIPLAMSCADIAGPSSSPSGGAANASRAPSRRNRTSPASHSWMIAPSLRLGLPPLASHAWQLPSVG